MKRERIQVRGILSLATLVRVNAVSGFALGVMFGVFAGVVSFLVHRNVLEMGLFVLTGPPLTALVLSMITLVGHPLYTLLAGAGFPGLDRISYENSSD